MKRLTKKVKPTKTFNDILLEKVSPITSLLLIFFPIVGSIFAPALVAYFLLIMYIYFFYKSVSLTIFFIIGVRRIRTVEGINWRALLNGLENPENEIKNLENSIKTVEILDWQNQESEAKSIYKKIASKSKIKPIKFDTLPNFIKRFLFWSQKRQAKRFLNEEKMLLMTLKNHSYFKPSELQHIIIIPHVKEPESILRETVQKLADQTFNTKQLNVVLAAEAADPNGVAVSEKIQKEFEGVFNNFWITNHVLQDYDAVGKSANMNWAGTEVYEKVIKLGWDLKKTTITSCDADSKFDPQHFAYLTHLYCTTQRAEFKFFNGAMMFYNNIWRLPFYARVKSSLNTIYNIANLIRTDKLVPFSTYTCSFWLMEQIDFWDPWVTPEDYHIFFKSLFKFNDRVTTIPMYIRILSDAAEGETHRETIMNNYKQTRRWSWGISDDGWMLKHFLKGFFTHSLRSKYITLHALFDHIIPLPLAVLILIGGILPGLINPSFSDQISGALFPIVTGNIASYTLIFLILIVIIDYLFKPKPGYFTFRKHVFNILEWIVQPVISFFFGALPTFDAQMRLLIGKYMEYYVTKKIGEEKK